MPEPMIEHANATLDIVDLLQALVGDCKCQANHVLTNLQSGQQRPMESPCEVLASHRYVHHCQGADKLVCEAFARDVRSLLKTAYCWECIGEAVELIPV